MELFAQATKAKLRFKSATVNGTISVEDLWGLTLTALNDIAVALVNELQTNSISFIDDSKVDKTTQLKFDVVKFIIDIKKQEQAEKLLAQENAARKQRLTELLYQKENEQLSQLSVEELRKQLAELS